MNPAHHQMRRFYVEDRQSVAYAEGRRAKKNKGRQKDGNGV